MQQVGFIALFGVALARGLMDACIAAGEGQTSSCQMDSGEGSSLLSARITKENSSEEVPHRGHRRTKAAYWNYGICAKCKKGECCGDSCMPKGGACCKSKIGKEFTCGTGSVCCGDVCAAKGSFCCTGATGIQYPVAKESHCPTKKNSEDEHHEQRHHLFHRNGAKEQCKDRQGRDFFCSPGSGCCGNRCVPPGQTCCKSSVGHRFVCESGMCCGDVCAPRGSKCCEILGVVYPQPGYTKCPNEKDDIRGVPVCYERSRFTPGCPLSSLDYGQPTYIAPGGRTACIDSTRPYVFQVTRGDPTKLLFFFQGGGLCFNGPTTLLQPACSTTITPLAEQGIFNRDDLDNPYADWTTVVVMYCSGDVHVGDARRSYTDANGDAAVVLQRGYWNALSTVDWVEREFPRLQDVVLAGSSAGSLGVQSWAQHIFGRLERQIEGRKAVIADAFLLISSPAPPALVYLEFGTCRLDLLPLDMRERCSHGQLSINDVFIAAMQANPDAVFSAINFKEDAVQMLFYNMVATAFEEETIGPEEYTRRMNTALDQLNEMPNFVSYVMDGAEHILLGTKNFSSATVKAEPACATKAETAHVACPVSGTRCAGDSCCPGITGLASGQVFPCPSAQSFFAGCVDKVKVRNCLVPPPSLGEWVTALLLQPGTSIESQCSGELLLAWQWMKKGAPTGSTYCDASQAGKSVRTTPRTARAITR